MTKGLAMKVAISSAMLAVWYLGTACSVHAQTSEPSHAGEVIAVTGESGSSVLVRGGETFSLTQGDLLFDGDRIVTRLGASVELRIDECTRTLDEGSTIIIEDEFCGAVFASAGQAVLAGSLVAQSATSGAAMPVLGGLGVAGVAMAQDDGDKRSLSPPPSSN
jgi:hypothetical protein